MKIKTSIAIISGCLVIFLFLMLPVFLSIQNQKEDLVASFKGSTFSLKDVNNNTITEKSFEGPLTAIFFGFTNCPDICPMTLSNIDLVINNLSERKRKDFKVFFVSIDPDRDSPSVIKNYLETFQNKMFGITGDPKKVFLVGCPSLDLINKKNLKIDNKFKRKYSSYGVGELKIDFDKPYVVVLQHPVTTEFGKGEQQITETLKAVRKFDIPAIVLWPNADAGSEDISKGMRKWREIGFDKKMHFYKNLPVDHYVTLLRKTSCLIGNSSSGIREGAFIGTPVINIGSRQDMRERGANVVDVGHEENEIIDALKKQISHGKYQTQPIYGDGTAGIKIAEILSSCNWKIQKRITY